MLILLCFICGLGGAMFLVLYLLLSLPEVHTMPSTVCFDSAYESMIHHELKNLPVDWHAAENQLQETLHRGGYRT